MWYAKENELMTLLHDMSKDPELLASYRKDPESVIGQYELSEKDKAALLSQDKQRIIDALTDDLAQ